MANSRMPSWKFKLHEIIYEADTPAGKAFDVVLLIVIILFTLTTEGFAHIAPITPLGTAIASLITITGYGIIAVPTGIMTAEYSRAGEKKPQLNNQICPCCNESKYLDEAEYCHNCGNPLND